MKQKITRSIVIPALETTIEGKLRGGFSSIVECCLTSRRGYNVQCAINASCSDNTICYNNTEVEMCQGNVIEEYCSYNGGTVTSTATSTSTSTSTSTAKLMADMFSLF